MKYFAILTILYFLSCPGMAQNSVPTLAEAITLALERNPGVQQKVLEVEKQSVLKRTAFEIPKTDVSLLYGQHNSIEKNDNNITISQSIPFPTVLGKQHALNNMLVRQAQLHESITRNELTFEVKQIVNQLHYLKARQQILLRQDSLLSHLTRIADLHYRTGEGTLLGKASAETQLAEMKNQLSRNHADIQTAIRHLQLVCQSPEITDIAGSLENTAQVLDLDSAALMENPAITLAKQNTVIANQQKKVEASRMMPDLRFGYFNQTLTGYQNVDGQEVYYGSDKRFQGFQFGLSFPLLFGPHSSRVRAADVATEAAQKQQEASELHIRQQYTQAAQELLKNKNSVEYLRSTALVTAELTTTQSKKSFESGELEYSVLLLNLRQALTIREEYLLALFQYNNSIITLEFLNGNK
jgi:cobalt-zinc-cadmium resistance protein CzcA